MSYSDIYIGGVYQAYVISVLKMLVFGYCGCIGSAKSRRGGEALA